MLRKFPGFMIAMVVGGFLISGVTGGDHSKSTDWMKAARYGVFIHFLPSDSRTFALVDDFDVNFLADQLDSLGAGYLVITLGQNSGYFNAPNAAYDRITGYRAGERCAARDLPMDLYKALKPKGIRLMLYLPSQAPNQDSRPQEAFGLAVGPEDQPINADFARKWAEVIQEWSERYGPRVSGWWFDGGYDHVGFNEEIAEIYSRAAKAGNPKSIVTFNPGVSLIRHTQAEDYTAGELNEPFQYVPTSRWVEGSQWQGLTFIGSHWSARDSRFPAGQWVDWVRKVVAGGGAVTLDMGPNWDPSAGPIGSLSDEQMKVVRAIRAAVRGAGN